MLSDLPLVSGVSIVRNATILDYPVEVALQSILPLVDELHVNVGLSEDDTLDRVRSLGDPRIRIHSTDWGDSSGRRLRDLGDETNRVLEQCRHDWALYIQADEVLHEEDLQAVRQALYRAAGREDVEGLAFDYLHFYGSPDWIWTGRASYRAEVRMIRRSSGVQSFSDAQGFRVHGRLPRVLKSGGRVFHYGYVKSEEALSAKLRLSKEWWGEDLDRATEWEFELPPGLEPFRGTHPAVAVPWIERRKWPFDPARAKPQPLTRRTAKIRVSNLIERLTGKRLIEHRTFQRVD
jgi:glycosyltransferase involved in cell wall biosynthesis